MTETDDILEMDLDMELDTTWIETAETSLTDYSPFYKKDVTYITVVRTYINSNDDVIRVSNHKENLDMPNTLTVRHLCALARNERVWKTYMYILSVDEDDVEILDDIEHNTRFFHDITNTIRDVNIERTIAQFHDINTLFLLIKESEPEIDNTPDKSVLEIELGSAKPHTRKKKHRKTVSFGGTKTRRIH